MIFILLLLLPVVLKAQIINTIAGDGTGGFTGNGTPAVSAEVNGPDGMAVDATGNIYFSDRNNHTIRKINTSGIITTLAGNGTAGFFGDGGPASAALLNHPGQLCLDEAGNIYFAEADNHVIRKISTTGMISSVAGTGAPGYVGDGFAATNARLNDPIGVALDGLGNMYIGDFYNNCVRKVTAAGIISTYAGTGSSGFAGDGFAASTALLCRPNYLVVDSANNLFISDNGNQRIRKVTASSGIITTYAGNGVPTFAGDGSPATTASLNYPGGFVFDGAGNCYIADYVNSRIRKVDNLGMMSTYAGTATAGYNGDGIAATTAQLDHVIALTFNHSGNLLLDDYNNNRIRIITACTNSITLQPVNDTVFAGASAIYTVATSVASPTYQWQEDPGTGYVDLANVWPYSGVTTNALTIHNASIYLNATHYRCVVNNVTSCPDTSAGAILIIKTVSGVASLNTPQALALYPNPVTTTLNIQSPAELITHVIISNMLGQTVFTHAYSLYNVQVDVADLAAGVYFVKVNSSEVRKFVKD